MEGLEYLEIKIVQNDFWLRKNLKGYIMDFSSKCKTKTSLIWVNYVWLHSLPQSMEYKDFLHVFYVSSVIIIFWGGTKHYKNSFCITPNLFFFYSLWDLGPSHHIMCSDCWYLLLPPITVTFSNNQLLWEVLSCFHKDPQTS